LSWSLSAALLFRSSSSTSRCLVALLLQSVHASVIIGSYQPDQRHNHTIAQAPLCILGCAEQSVSRLPSPAFLFLACLGCDGVVLSLFGCWLVGVRMLTPQKVQTNSWLSAKAGISQELPTAQKCETLPTKQIIAVWPK
jgi:hypothetical protein